VVNGEVCKKYVLEETKGQKVNKYFYWIRTIVRRHALFIPFPAVESSRRGWLRSVKWFECFGLLEFNNIEGLSIPLAFPG